MKMMMMNMTKTVTITGCPTDSSIMQSMTTVGSAKILQANFDAFKFPSSPLVQFRALVTPCMPRCDPVRCEDRGKFFSSFGRRKRDIPEDGMEDVDINDPRTNNGSDHASVVVANAVHIVDSFQLKRGDSLPDSSASCVFDSGHTLAVCVVLSVFLVCQCVLLMLCVRGGGSRAREGRDVRGEHLAVFGYQVNTDSVEKVNT